MPGSGGYYRAIGMEKKGAISGRLCDAVDPGCLALLIVSPYRTTKNSYIVWLITVTRPTAFSCMGKYAIFRHVRCTKCFLSRTFLQYTEMNIGDQTMHPGIDIWSKLGDA